MYKKNRMLLSDPLKTFQKNAHKPVWATKVKAEKSIFLSSFW